jgi:hypothetical protein
MSWEEFQASRLGAAQNCSATLAGNHRMRDAAALPETVSAKALYCSNVVVTVGSHTHTHVGIASWGILASSAMRELGIRLGEGFNF